MIPTLGLVSETMLLRKRTAGGGKAGLATLSIGRQTAKLVGFALSLLCEPAGGVPHEDRWLSRVPQDVARRLAESVCHETNS